MDMTRERNSLIFELRSMFLSSQMILSFVSAADIASLYVKVRDMASEFGPAHSNKMAICTPRSFFFNFVALK